ncbi:MAG: glycosyltransferase family 2 protein [candidate division Zixibacteria bacterium]|nr:glycosyltransferase family 2 protein [candidate division Zixibacteria bacterium]NIR67330.1 glycosyltransferase family 2 protein [candidate division Zixibacteria bacterium]NIS16207.1 glycosyltransferase family 2 protein [candidate division Zixibacteria bacterium]NIS48706.1 glycosyltransferase family 2 protein [candidate division Zixibacteria bacterium]NIT52599.1 glycosyltransferase family 2 protein [candidate division Zixibacteria bacterium]
MLISVIIPLYNGHEVIVKCLDSVFSSETDHNIEVIVVDDCSTDESVDLINRKGYDIYLMKNDKNHGYAYTVNRGLTVFHGDAAFLLNQDTELEKNVIQLLASRLFEDDLTGIIAPQLVNLDGTVQPSVRCFPRHSDIIYHHLGLSSIFRDNAELNRWKMPDFDHISERYVDQPAFSAVMIKRTAINEVGLMDLDFPLFFNDVDYCRRTIAAGWKILFYPKAKVKHQRGQAISQRKVQSIYLSHLAFIEYLHKYFRNLRYVIPNFLCSFLLVVSAHIRALYHLLKKSSTSKEPVS